MSRPMQTVTVGRRRLRYLESGETSTRTLVLVHAFPVGSAMFEPQLDAFRGGRLDVLMNCIVLGEGFDCPELKTVF